MEQQAKVRTGYVAGDFMTRTYRISGEVALRGEPVLDQLNNLNTLFITLERVYVSPLLDPAVLTGNYATAEVRKDNVGIVILNQARDGLPYREGRYVGRDHVRRQLLIVTAGFEVRGSLPLHPSVNVPNFVRTTPEDFIPLFDAKAILTANHQLFFEGAAILLNRREIEVFSLVES
jgi:hypothetical protein